MGRKSQPSLGKKTLPLVLRAVVESSANCPIKQKHNLWQIQIKEQMAMLERREMGQSEKLVKRVFIESVFGIRETIGNVS
jgi:hypothetical protein